VGLVSEVRLAPLVPFLSLSLACFLAGACATPRGSQPETTSPPAARPSEATARRDRQAPRATPPAAAKGDARASFALPAGCAPASARYACDPLTNAGCRAASGEACDDDDDGGFKCYPPPNAVPIGGDCNIVDGPSCAPGLGCDGVSERDPDGECARFCCTKSDCGAGEKCVPGHPDQGALGFCE
jgi:hypothetical protein